ncbi:MAG: hypothetical protein ACSLEY_00460 [Candidatus Saccharimonadales bacterium]
MTASWFTMLAAVPLRSGHVAIGSLVKSVALQFFETIAKILIRSIAYLDNTSTQSIRLLALPPSDLFYKH